MQNLITVIPGSITIQNFIPGKIYKEAIVIYNTCNVPITIKLTTSDKNKLLLNESIIRLGVNHTKKINIIIQDKVKYNYNKFPFQKKLFIHLKGDLIDEKFEINLYYFVKGGYNPINNLNDVKNIQRQIDNFNLNNINNPEFNNTNNNNFNNTNNSTFHNTNNNNFNNNNNNNDNNNNDNIDEEYLRSTKFLDNINSINNNNNNPNNYNNNNYNNNYNNNNYNNNYNITNEDEYNIPISINKVEEFSIFSNVNNNEIDLNLNENLSNEEKISELKNTIKILFNKLNTMNKLLIEYENKITETNKIFSLNSKDYNKEQISLFFISDSSFMKNLNKIEPEIDIKNTKVQNELLTTENKILNQRIKDLEDKLMYITGENIDNNNVNNNNNNDNNNNDNNNNDNNIDNNINNNNYYNNSNGAVNNNELHEINEEDDNNNNNIDSDNINNLNSDNNIKEENPLTYSNSNKLNSSENDENNNINNNNNNINIVDNNNNNNYDNNENDNNNIYNNYNIDNNNNNNNHEIIESNNLNIDPEFIENFNEEIDNINNENENENL